VKDGRRLTKNWAATPQVAELVNGVEFAILVPGVINQRERLGRLTYVR
jgi:hypothetical protein